MAIHTDAIAQVYARSLYELANAAGGHDKIVEIAEELEQICELARSNKKFGEFLASPIVENKARSNSIRAIFHGRITDLTLRFLLVLNAKGRLSRIESIRAAYDQSVHEAFDRVEVDVYTPAPLGNDQIDTIKQRIQAVLGKDPVIHAYTDPEMIGGIRLRIGDQLIDGSVSSRLRRLRERLLANGGSQVRSRISKIIEEGAN